MTRDQALEVITRHAAELRSLGVTRLSLFGSVARGEARTGSDIDVAVILEDGITGLRALGRLDQVGERLALLLGTAVDVVPEPGEVGPLQAAIERDRCVAFA